MRIYPLDHSSLNELKPLIAKWNFIPFKEYGIDQDLIVNYVIAELSDIISRGNFAFVAEEHGTITGLVSLDRAEWDSKHFGQEIAKIHHLIASGEYSESLDIKRKLLSHLLTECFNNGVNLVCARVNKEDVSSIHALEGSKFKLVGVLVTYARNLKNERILPLPNVFYHIRQIRQDDFSELEDIAKEAFGATPVATDHFHADPTLPREKSDMLYVEWLRQSYVDPFGTVFVAEIAEKPVGFNVCTVNELLAEKLGIHLGAMTLTAVKSSERRQHVATSLINASLAWFAGKVDIVESGGQASNYAIQRAWNKNGLEIIRSQCTFHCSTSGNSI